MSSFVPLEISLDYPVNWKFDRIIRDLVQNFYDAIGRNDFGNKFIYEIISSSGGSFDITMKCKGYPFSYEWLTYVGGSTKTDHPGDYAGMYGEGFKICMLILVRNGYAVTMESSDWSLKPCSYEMHIDGKNEKILGYNIFKRDDDGWTCLIIKNIPSDNYDYAKEGMLHFLYDGNPLLGRRIAGNKFIELYERSKMEIPCRNDECNGRGILFCNMLARGVLDLDVVIAIKKDMRSEDSRKREVLELWESISILNRISKYISPRASYQLLLRMKKYWNYMPQNYHDVYSWYYFICQLVRNIAGSDKYKKRFMSEYTKLMYVKKRTGDKTEDKTIRAVNAWYRLQEKYNEYQLVNPIFRLLGALSVVDEYESQKLEEIRNPTEEEKEFVEFLFSAYERVFDYYSYDERPKVKIIKSGNRYSQIQFSSRNNKRNSNIKYKLSLILLTEEVFTQDFADAFMFFAEKVLYVYGTPHSACNNLMMTELLNCIAKNITLLEQYANIWKEKQSYA